MGYFRGSLVKRNHEVWVFYDNQCGFCCHWIAFVKQRVGSKPLRFEPLLSDEAIERLSAYGLDARVMDSVVFLQDDALYTQSGAVIRLLATMRFPWCCLCIGWLIPRFIRDALYRYVAQHRSRLQGCGCKIH